QRVNDTLRRIEKLRRDAEPSHVEALLRFAARAWRRPLTNPELEDLTGYYRTLRQKDGLPHEDAIRDAVVSVLLSPKFCYRLDLVDAANKAEARTGNSTLSGNALASRLSYFLWASKPDDELLAAAGNLQDQRVLLAQTRRMLKDPRSRGLALEFGGNWLDVR